MKKYIKKSLIITILFLISFGFINSVSASSNQKVNVKIATFPVELNGVLVSQENTNYPMIVYKDITYLPMTADYADLINLNAHWIDEKRQLVIFPTNYPILSYTQPNYYENANKEFPTTNLKATFVNYDIIIKNEITDLKKDPYPVLNFRNITYFPLTWNYAVNSFGLSYQYTQEKGLQIKSAGYQADKLPEKLPGLTPIHPNKQGSVTPLKASKIMTLPKNAFTMPIYFINNQLYYFVNQKQNMEFWRQAINGKSEKIGEAKIATGEGMGYYYPNLVNNKLLFTSHFGGVTMGTDYNYLLPENQNSYLLGNQRYSWIIPWKDQFIAAKTSVTGPISGLVMVDAKGNEQNFADSKAYYTLSSLAMKSPYSPFIKDDLLYVKKSEHSNTDTIGHLYQLNLVTGTETMLLENINQYFVDQSTIYFTEAENTTLYAYDIKTRKREFYGNSAKEYQNFTGFDGNIIFLKDNNLYQVKPDQLVLLSKNIVRWQANPSYLVYMTKDKNKSEIIICDDKAQIINRFGYSNKDVDFMLNQKDLIIWSWQDQKVHIFQLP